MVTTAFFPCTGGAGMLVPLPCARGLVLYVGYLQSLTKSGTVLESNNRWMHGVVADPVR